jgi:hypothetical protein
MKRLIVLLVTVAALGVPSTALAGGVVLKVQRSTHLVAIATTSTHVALVHTTAKVRVGQRVALSARTLRNGTLAASSVRVVGRAHRVRFRGLVLAKTRTRLVVSANGAVVAVARGARATASARDGGPQPGTEVDVTATISSSGELDEDDVEAAPAAPGGKIEGRLTLGTGTVTVRAEEMTLVINVPAGFDLSKFKTGDEVLATFTQDTTTGALTLTALSGDENAQQADENDDNDGSDDGGGGDGGGD